MRDSTSIIRIVCRDEPGLVSKVSSLLYRADCNVTENDEFVDPGSGFFFMRTAFEGNCDEAALESELKAILPENAAIECFRQRKKRIVVMATKEAHCLGDLLIRSNFNDLSADIQAVVSNHDLLADLTERLGHTFHCIGHEGISRAEHEERVLALIEDYAPDYIVMAKYMRILSDNFINRHENRIINIHHSFLPAFVGANPYRKAYERGVKIIGATAHFASLDLDEGPIIAQGTIPVNHAQSVESMIRNGRDVEKSVLSKALQLVFEDCVFVHGNRTVVFG